MSRLSKFVRGQLRKFGQPARNSVLPRNDDLCRFFDEAEYLAANKDVSSAVAAGKWSSGWEHYCQVGRDQGRSVTDRLTELRRGIDKKDRGLEVGPYFAPICPKKDGYNCISLDVFDTDTLRRMASRDQNIRKRKIGNIETVDIVGSATEMDVLLKDEKLKYVVSSHNFEHLPNPIKFLRSVEAALEPDGILNMAVPDHRYCFDYFRWPTKVDEWLDAYFTDTHRPTQRQIFRQEAFRGDGKGSSFEPLKNVRSAYLTWQSLNASQSIEYIDAHCSTFTPASLSLLMLDLKYLGLINMSPSRIIGPNGLEMYLQMKKTERPIPEEEYHSQRSTLLHLTVLEQSMRVKAN